MDKHEFFNIIKNAFPELQINDFSVLGHGKFATACLVNKNIVFKISNIGEKFYKQAKHEDYIISKLSNKLSFGFPHILYRIREYDNRFIFGESLVSGITYTQELHDSFDEQTKNGILQQIGRIMRELHDSEFDDSEKVLSVSEYTDTVNVYNDYFSESVRACFSKQEIIDIEKMRERYEDLSINHPVKKVLVHGDLHFANMMFDKDKKQISGLIDFGAAHFAEPSRDMHYYYGDGAKNILIGYGETSDIYLPERQKFQSVINFLSNIGDNIKANKSPDKDVKKLLGVVYSR